MLEKKVGARTIRVFSAIVQCLLRNSVQIGLDLLRQPFVPRISGTKVRFDIKMLRPLFDIVFKRRVQTEVIEGHGPQLPREKIYIRVELFDDHHQSFDRIGGLLWIGG